MLEIPMSTPIAKRSLRFIRGDGSEAQVGVTLGMPIPDPRAPTRAWACPYEITGLGAPIRHAAFAGDGMRALIFALHALPSELRALAREDRSGRFVDGEDLGLNDACKTNLDVAV
jgi:Domain of unknown function (DUF6968)